MYIAQFSKMCCDRWMLFFVFCGYNIIVRGTSLPQNVQASYEEKLKHDVTVNVTDDVIEVRKSSQMVIHCQVTSNDPIQLYVWTKDGVALQTSRRVNIYKNGSLSIEKFVTKRRRNDSGLYECFVTNTFGTFIGARVQAFLYKPTVRVVPGVSEVTPGGVARFQCGLGTRRDDQQLYVWHHESTMLDSQNTLSTQAGILHVYDVTAGDAGTYVCQVLRETEHVEIPQNSAVLAVTPGNLPPVPRILDTPQNVSAKLGNHAVLECVVEGGNDVTVVWKFKGSVLDLGSGVRRTITGRSALWFQNVELTDNGTYTCIVKYKGGLEVTRDFHLHVLVPPRFTATPSSQNAVMAQKIRLTCQAEGNPAPNITWYKDGHKMYPAPGKTLSTMVMLRGSREDTGYYQCVASNSVGLTMTTAWIEIKRNVNTPEAVENVTAEALSATEINVTWAPAHTADGFPIISYTVEYQRVHDEPCPGRCRYVAQSDNFPTGDTQLVLDRLQPFTKYSFAVQAFSAVGGGDSSHSVEVRTLEAVPTGYPNVQIAHDSTSSFRVSWSEIPEDSRHGVITGYKLRYGRVGRERMMTVVQFEETTRAHLVTDVEPDSVYSVCVLAGNSQGYPSCDKNWVTYKTPKATQNETSLTELVFVPINTTSVAMSWSSHGTMLEGGSFRVMIQKLIHAGSVREFEVDKNTNKLIIHDLEYREFYKIDFYVRNKDNDIIDHVTEVYQSLSTADEQQPPPPVTIVRDSVSSSKISLSWAVPKTMLAIVMYTISYRKQSGEYAESGNATYVTTREMDITLQGLQPFSWYVVEVRSHTHTSIGPFSKPVIVQTEEGIPSPPEYFSGELVSPGTVKLQWVPPRKQNGIITYYIIYYNSENVQDGSWASMKQNASITSVVVEDLVNKVYYFKLRACTNAGESDESHVIMIDTTHCDDCTACQPVSNCVQKAVKTDSSRSSKSFEQNLGIIIGCGVGLLCIVVCVTFVVYKQRQMRRLYAERAQALLAARGLGRYLSERGVAKYHHDATYSPMLARMIENRDFSEETEMGSALLGSTISGSQTKTESCSLETTSGESENREREDDHQFPEHVGEPVRSQSFPVDKSQEDGLPVKICGVTEADETGHVTRSRSNNVMSDAGNHTNTLFTDTLNSNI